VLRARFATATSKIIQHLESAQRATAAEALWEKFCFDCVTIVTVPPGPFDVRQQQHDNGHRFRFANGNLMAVEVKTPLRFKGSDQRKRSRCPFYDILKPSNYPNAYSLSRFLD
jgi:hypothetical protein